MRDDHPRWVKQPNEKVTDGVVKRCSERGGRDRAVFRPCQRDHGDIGLIAEAVIDARACAGPGYTWTDTTRTNITGERHDRSGVVLVYEGAAGLERDLGAGVSVRLEGGYANANPVEQAFAGLALVYSWE